MSFAIHRRFPKEMAIIGEILLEYSELELDLMLCVEMARNGDLNTTLKSMFRIRGETPRINVADALGRQCFMEMNLADKFDVAISAMRRCLKFRNKMAHSAWHDPEQGKRLCYISLEDLANIDEEIINLFDLDFFFLDEDLLKRHKAYFEYTQELFTFVNYEWRLRANQLSSNPFRWPAPLEPPPLYTQKLDNRRP